MSERFKIYMVSLMNDSRTGTLAALLRKLLLGPAWCYAAVINLKELTYRLGIRKELKAGIPVISVGNLTVGGTGKTPFTIYLAELIMSRGYEVAVITRGYGGDENIMLKEMLPSAHIIVERDRYKAAVLAERQGRGVAILDDGYQHRRLERDLNLVLVDAGEGFGNGKTLPRGLLREPPEAIRRADMVIITKCDKVSSKGLDALEGAIDGLTGGAVPVLAARHNVLRLSGLKGVHRPADHLKGRKVGLVSGIADPWYFEFIVRRQGAEIVWHSKYTDHHRYTLDEVRELCRRNVREVDQVLTTRKDLVKLRHLLPDACHEIFFAVDVELDIVKGKEKLLAGLDSIGIG